MQVESCTMSFVVKPYRPGVEARAALLRELRRRESDRAPAPSAARLARELSWPRSTLDEHVTTLCRLGWTTRTIGRNGAIHLTDAGRNAADML